MKPGDEESINRNCKPCNANGCNVRVYIFRKWITWWILTVELWLAPYTRRTELLDPNSQAKANFAHVGTAHSSDSCPETNLQLLFLRKFKSWIVRQSCHVYRFFLQTTWCVAAKLLSWDRGRTGAQAPDIPRKRKEKNRRSRSFLLKLHLLRFVKRTRTTTFKFN